MYIHVYAYHLYTYTYVYMYVYMYIHLHVEASPRQLIFLRKVTAGMPWVCCVALLNCCLLTLLASSFLPSAYLINIPCERERCFWRVGLSDDGSSVGVASLGVSVTPLSCCGVVPGVISDQSDFSLSCELRLPRWSSCARGFRFQPGMGMSLSVYHIRLTHMYMYMM